MANRQEIPPGRLDQNSIAKAEFYRANVTLGVRDKIEIGKLFQAVNVSHDRAELAANADAFLRAVRDLAKDAGGNPPLPAPPDLGILTELDDKTGNDRLAAILKKAPDLHALIDDSRTRAQRKAQRLPAWQTLEAFMAHADGLEGAEDAVAEARAIRDKRRLLDETDHVVKPKAQLADLLRRRINEQHERHVAAFDNAMAQLDASNDWQQLDRQQRDAILRNVGLARPGAPELGDDEAICRHLQQRPLSSVEDEIDAIPARVQRALEAAAKRLEPKIQPITVERATLQSQDDIEAWLERMRQRLTQAVNDGPVLVS
jgi:hypothetical protein